MERRLMEKLNRAVACWRGVKDTKEVDTIFHQVKMMDHMGFMGLQSLFVFDQQWTVDVEGEERNVLAAFGEIKEV